MKKKKNIIITYVESQETFAHIKKHAGKTKTGNPKVSEFIRYATAAKVKQILK